MFTCLYFEKQISDHESRHMEKWFWSHTKERLRMVQLLIGGGEENALQRMMMDKSYDPNVLGLIMELLSGVSPNYIKQELKCLHVSTCF